MADDKPAMKTIGLSFFQLIPTRTTDGTEDFFREFEELSAAFKSTPEMKANHLTHPNGRIALHGKVILYDGGFLMGTLVNNQMTDIPPMYDNSTQAVKALTLESTQGLAHPTSFLFDPKVNILMIELIRGGVGMASLVRYFRHNLTAAPAFDANIVINPSEMEKLSSMTAITKFRVKIAKLRSGFDLNQSQKKSVGQIIESADDTNTDSLDYTISAKRSESLKVNKIKRFAQTFLKIGDGQDVKVLKVTGNDGESGNFAIDLIEGKLKDSFAVPRERVVGDFNLDNKYKMMIQQYREHITMLRRSYRVERPKS